jgi:Family of unknown function (DUF5682)
MALTVFGIRHHGPGCARSLRRALDELRPDAVVIEGPPDAEGVLSWVSHAGIKPPVALLVYPADEPRRAVYYPLAVFSPEWQALTWAAASAVPVWFMDLPQSHQLALEKAEADAKSAAVSVEADPDGVGGADSENQDAVPDGAGGEQALPSATTAWQADPLAVIAEAAGYKDHELWWEDQIERRSDAIGLFAAIGEAMLGVRSELPETTARNLIREAYMRKTLRAVIKEGFQNVAVVCGAWHAPVLDALAVAGKRAGLKIKDDNERLSALPKVKTTATWIPWTYSRLTYRSGYGAGVNSPGWYGHLWESNDAAPTRWLATAARLLRDKDLDASSASVVEARRLADALAAMRDIRSPGLAELSEAIVTVFCHGESAPLELIRAGLEISDVIGAVPDDAPSVPLVSDLARQQSSLRLKPSTEVKRLDLDLRKDVDLARSRLLHRLIALEIPWGKHEQSGGKSSTFHELWLLEWMPEFAVALIEANIWGNTVESAATAKLIHAAGVGSELGAVTAHLETSIHAGLPAAVDPLLARIQAMSALAADVRHLMDAILPLARVARYGDVRGTDAGHVEPILQGMFERTLVGVASACSALDDDAALRMVESIGRLEEALRILNRHGLEEEWRGCLLQLLRKAVHPLICGWCCRLLLDARSISNEDLYRFARLALAPANPPADCAAWATGLLRGNGMALLHQDALWQVFDRWLCELSPPVFMEMLPLVRRAFADFTGPERRQMGEKVRHLGPGAGERALPAAAASETALVDHVRAARVLPILAHILGTDCA